MAQYFECGHNKAWALALNDKGRRHVYCLGCIAEKLELRDYNQPAVMDKPVDTPKRVEQKQKLDELKQTNKE